MRDAIGALSTEDLWWVGAAVSDDPLRVIGHHHDIRPSKVAEHIAYIGQLLGIPGTPGTIRTTLRQWRNDGAFDGIDLGYFPPSQYVDDV